MKLRVIGSGAHKCHWDRVSRLKKQILLFVQNADVFDLSQLFQGRPGWSRSGRLRAWNGTGTGSEQNESEEIGRCSWSWPMLFSLSSYETSKLVIVVFLCKVPNVFWNREAEEVSDVTLEFIRF
jgi:hypothetical protein